MRGPLRVLLATLLLLGAAATAQVSFDVAGGAGSVAANWQLGTGGTWTAVSATAMVNQHLGINADFNTRALGQLVGSRPYLADINVALRASPARFTPEFDLGWGIAGIATGGSCLANPLNGCSNSGRQISMGTHMSISVTTYLNRRIFLRPVYHLYVGNDIGHPNFFGVMVGYSFGRQ